MNQVLLVGVGGFLGCVGRFLISSSLTKNNLSSFPVSTLLVNLLGSFLIGFFIIFIPKTSQNLFSFMIPGLLGGFTTFSAFSLETTNLIEKQLFVPAILYVLGSVIGGMILCYLGISGAKSLLES